jgi:hypothetical protein
MNPDEQNKPDEQSKTHEPNGDAAGKNGGKDNKAQGSAERLFSQAEVDRIVKERLEREQEKAQNAAKKAAETARAEAEAKALAEQGEFKKLFEQASDKLKALESLQAQAEAAQENAKRLEKALVGYRDARFGEVPEHIQVLLKRMEVVEQIEWLTANAGKLAGHADEKATPAKGTPRPAHNKGKGGSSSGAKSAEPMKVNF